jgi:transposase InsO family protein
MAILPRGRPQQRVDPDLRRAILAMLDLMGPQVGLPTLRHLFPDASRGELLDLQRRYRRFCRHRDRCLRHVLEWTRPGTVWAMDFTEPPAPIDAVYDQVFCVRDLASGKQLMGLPCPGKSARVVVSTLTALSRWLGCPLVLKCDNDAVFTAGEFAAWARDTRVLLLFSPEHTPAYNGAIEAGIGSLQTRAQHAAVRHGRPGEWTCDDVEAAVRQANETARPWGRNGPTPDEAWRHRLPLPNEEREQFLATYRRRYARECIERGVPWGVHLQHREKASIDRVAISRALIDHGFLFIRRRRIAPPISRARADRIS